MSGGGIEVRFKTTGNFPPVFSFGAPSLKASCSGISFDAGYAVFMNLERLGQQLSQAGASLAYGVLIGLVYTMPGVEQAFTKLNEWSQWLQSFLSESCNIGTAIGKSLGRTAWRGVEEQVNDMTAKIPSPNDYLGKPIDYANLIEKVMTNGTSDQKHKVNISILDDLLSDGRGGIVGTYITSLIKKGEENVAFSTSEMIQFKNLDSIGLTDSTKLMVYFISSIIDDVAIDELAMTNVLKDIKANNAKSLAETIESKGGKEKTFKTIQARNKNSTEVFISFMLNGKQAADTSTLSNLRGLRVAMFSLDNKTGVRDQFVTLTDQTTTTSDPFGSFEGYIQESKKLVYKTYNQALIDLKKVPGSNPITGTINVTSAYPVMYDLIRNIVLASDKKQLLDIDSSDTDVVDMLNYISYKNAILLVGLAVDNMNQVIIKTITELDNKKKDSTVTNPEAKTVTNSTAHIDELKRQKVALDKEIEKIKEKLNELSAKVESTDSVRKMNERFSQLLRERNLQKGDR